MAELKISPFRRTQVLKSQIDEMLDVVSQGALTYKHGILHYIRHGWDDAAEQKFQQLSAFEDRGDTLRGAIGQALYTEMLLPDTSGDVLGLLGFLDRLLDEMKHGFMVVRIERPKIPAEFNEIWIECVGLAVDTVEQVVVAARSYFRDPRTTRDHIHKIHFLETETEEIALRIMEQLFQSELSLDRKLLLRGQVWLIDRIADLADDAGDALAIYAVKRSV
jgi:predicted phosphate transport protein (TIGR00153 family)